MKQKYDVIILGAGPAGLTSAIYALRANLKVLLIENNFVGGQILATSEIENYPAVSKTSGFELMQNMQKQAEDFGIEIANIQIIKIDFKEKKLFSQNDFYSYEALILAMGTSPSKLGILNEDNFIGKGISFCATCDGAFYKDKDVAVIGGGNAALEEAIFLSKFAKKVYIIHRREKFRADKIIQERVKNNPKIELLINSIIKEICGTQKIEKLILNNSQKQEDFELPIDGVFVYIGTKANTTLIENEIKLNEKAFVLTNSEMQTNLENVFAAGDIREKSVRQVITACADGAIAAMSAVKYLENK